MKLIELRSEKDEAQPSTLRALSPEECHAVAGGDERQDYESWYGGGSSKYSSNKRGMSNELGNILIISEDG